MVVKTSLWVRLWAVAVPLFISILVLDRTGEGGVIAGDPSTKINKYLYVNLLFPLLIAEIADFYGAWICVL